MNALSRSWQLTKLSFRVIGQDKELLLYPLLSLLLSVAFLIALLYPTLWVQLSDDGSIEWGFLEIMVTFVTYLGVAFIATFFNVCVVFTAKTRFEGGDATFAQSVRFALSRVHLILGWATISATVGLIFRAIDHLAERLGGIGEIVVGVLRSLLGMVWSVITMFVIPAMVYKGLTPIPAIKDSFEVLKQTWGESLVRHFGFGLVQFLCFFAGALAFGGLFRVMSPSGALSGALVVLAIIYFVGVVFVFLLAEMIFNTALYHYAANGELAPGYDEETMRGAFRVK
ncbi:MAG: hypothetical protein H6713_00460 [Myxococcales bacterium]|nr:hypothetical protein [Myxococcales bacterium]MCB9748453.1 hypothetical protein [Myxococcales bacterium]